MIKVNAPGEFLIYDGRLTEVKAIADGKVLIMEDVKDKPCNHCKHKPKIVVLESSPNFQKSAQSVKTISE